ncbi:type II secretion system minor pseudopilin GspJ [Shewanella sp. NIFS-20-20]|uniref:type II secretion system minor pseudopilin GspJ n=1 Tax=Shewanella sp. NIFS-20-20 TaxID=2853806 RepID=UPI001C446781|nr:type II secretion system minor pseudopilin GspJ [Shewanella sp. NIFS-20-20]MBV7316698.1 type II secretion system minor pseudopilin GspJ [Shewanella sp. NIFS-20-20]
MSRIQTNKRSLRGFTLLEMLIAIAIFAMLGLAANSVLQAVIKNDEVTRDFAKHLQELQLGFGAITRDLQQMVPRTPRGADGAASNVVLQSGSGLLDSDDEAIMFYRIGWLNPDGLLPRGSVQAIAYVLIEDRLERWHFPYPDPDIGAEPVKTVLMDNVLAVNYAFFVNDSWQTKIDGTQMPLAIAMKVEQEGFGMIERKFLLPENSLVKNNNNDDGNSNGGDDTDNKDDDQNGTGGDDTGQGDNGT